jgi:hypothetical protein
MRKPREVEEMTKRAIRDELALHPLLSVARIQGTLQRAGYAAIHGPLDWHYVNKLVKKVRQENLASLFPKDRAERFAMLQERHRAITGLLIPIVEGKWTGDINGDRMVIPTSSERIAAANTILKWDMTLFFAEEQVKAIETVERGQPLRVEPIMIEAKVKPIRSFSRKDVRSTTKIS